MPFTCVKMCINNSSNKTFYCKVIRSPKTETTTHFIMS